MDAREMLDKLDEHVRAGGSTLAYRDVEWLTAMAREAVKWRVFADVPTSNAAGVELEQARAASDRLLAEINGVQPGEGKA